MRRGQVIRNGKTVIEQYVKSPADYELQIRGYELYVDGSVLEHSSAIIPSKRAWRSPNRVPEGYYIVLGDDRNDSNDSHLWGFLKRKQIIGKVQSIFWPLGHFKNL
jgi:signal peptidase I